MTKFPTTTECILSSLEDKIQENVKSINNKIKERTSYGRRDEKATTPSMVISWSNESTSWYASKRVKKGENVNLDANQLLIKTIPMRQLELALGCLETLPLYGNAFESKSKRN